MKRAFLNVVCRYVNYMHTIFYRSVVRFKGNKRKFYNGRHSIGIKLESIFLIAIRCSVRIILNSELRIVIIKSVIYSVFMLCEQCKKGAVEASFYPANFGPKH